MMKQPLILSFYDISKFFDKELLVDALDACYEAGVKGKLYRLLFLLNKDTKIAVKTGTGVSETAETGENVGQGTVEGAIVSASSVDKTVINVFSQSKLEISYASERLQPFLFQDDILRASDSVESLMHGNALIEHVMEDKLLNLNKDKSKYMVIGNKKIAKEIRKRLEAETIRLSGNEMSESETEKYLGDYFHSEGNDLSVVTTVKRRLGKAMSAITDIKNVVNDVRSDVVVAIKTGIEIFELSVIPFVLFNSEVWDHIPSEAMKLLNKIHLTFLRTLLKTPITTPIPSLYWETGSLDMLSKVEKRKLTFYHHIVNLDDSALAKKFADIQDKNNFPGLIAECKLLLRKYELSDLIIDDYSKLAWKKLVKNAIVAKFKEKLLSDMKKYKKIDHVRKVNEEFGLQNYLKNMSLKNARMKFAIETEMVEKIKFNFMSDIQYEKQNWACDYCLGVKGVYKPDSMHHVTQCENYAFLRQDLNLDQDNDVVIYFTKVVELRNNMTK